MGVLFRRSLLALCLSSTLGCEPEFPEGHLVSELRILAVRATPPEAAIGESVHVAALVASPDPGAPQVSMWKCAARGGMRQGCEDMEDATPITDSTEGVFWIGDDWRNPLDRAAPLSVHQVITVVARLGDEVERGIKRIVVSDETPRNSNPSITAFRFGEEEEVPTEVFLMSPGASVQVRPILADGAVETYRRWRIDGTRSETREELFASYYWTCGSAPRLKSGGPEGLGARYRAPSEPSECSLWVIVRDDRGGCDWASRQISVRE